MPRYPAPELHDVPEDIRARILEVQEKSGFIPNVFLGLARRPAEWRAFLLPDQRVGLGSRRLVRIRLMVWTAPPRRHRNVPIWCCRNRLCCTNRLSGGLPLSADTLTLRLQ